MRHIHEVVDVKRPVDVCYRFWHQFEKFPQFMRHVRSVEPVEGAYNVWHWVVDGPRGRALEWDAKVIIDKPNAEIVWESVGDDNDLETTGHVKFIAMSPTVTRITVDLAFETATPFGEQLGALFAHPHAMVRDDLNRFKYMAEHSHLMQEVPE